MKRIWLVPAIVLLTLGGTALAFTAPPKPPPVFSYSGTTSQAEPITLKVSGGLTLLRTRARFSCDSGSTFTGLIEYGGTGAAAPLDRHGRFVVRRSGASNKSSGGFARDRAASAQDYYRYSAELTGHVGHTVTRGTVSEVEHFYNGQGALQTICRTGSVSYTARRRGA